MMLGTPAAASASLGGVDVLAAGLGAAAAWCGGLAACCGDEAPGSSAKGMALVCEPAAGPARSRARVAGDARVLAPGDWRGVLVGETSGAAGASMAPGTWLDCIDVWLAPGDWPGDTRAGDLLSGGLGRGVGAVADGRDNRAGGFSHRAGLVSTGSAAGGDRPVSF